MIRLLYHKNYFLQNLGATKYCTNHQKAVCVLSQTSPNRLDYRFNLWYTVYSGWGGKPPTNTGARRERRRYERGHDTLKRQRNKVD